MSNRACLSDLLAAALPRGANHQLGPKRVHAFRFFLRSSRVTVAMPKALSFMANRVSGPRTSYLRLAICKTYRPPRQARGRALEDKFKTAGYLKRGLYQVPGGVEQKAAEVARQNVSMRKPVFGFGRRLFFCKDLELYGISVALLRSLLSYPHGRATACDQPVPMPRDPIQWKAGLFSNSCSEKLAVSVSG